MNEDRVVETHEFKTQFETNHSNSLYNSSCCPYNFYFLCLESKRLFIIDDLTYSRGYVGAYYV
jgi:hypothetical protein